MILNDRPGALHVKLEAPVKYRIANAAAVEGISPDQAALRQVREDAARAEISLDVWGWDPRRTAFYDLVVNVATFGVDGTIAMILDAFQRKQALAAAPAS